MTINEQDPDVVRWGLHLLDGCTLTNRSPGTITRYGQDSSQVSYVEEGYCEPKCVNVENDEMLAHALQEELSQISAMEAAESFPSGGKHQQASVLAQDWLGPSRRYCSCAHGNCSACFSSGEKSVDEEWSGCPEIADGNDIDGELGKRLSQMVPISHIPKINGEIPTVDEATSDHQRLLDRLLLYDVVELKVVGDGNCQFRSLSDQIYRTTEHHKFVRQQIVDQLKSHPELYEGYVPMSYFDYLKKMSKTGEWGDHVTLQAAADSYGIKIFIITSFRETCYIEILPHSQKSNRIIFLSFWAEVHYNSIYPQGEFPEQENKKKKKWWWLGN